VNIHLRPYEDLLASKHISFQARGFKPGRLSSALFDHQRAVTDFALRQGCAALFLDTGLGKTLCALEWGRSVVKRTNRPVLMLAPLAVSFQHAREAEKFGIDARAIREPEEVAAARIYITNYERLDRFDVSRFGGVILDESSILKSFTGATTRALIKAFAGTPYRLACTATPAPNDHMELGQHSQFLGAMPANEMLSRWFLSDQTQMGRYRLKKPAVKAFWDWVASWSRCVSKPSDLGFSDDGFALPELNLHRHIVQTDWASNAGAEKDGQARLLRMPETSATSIHREKRMSLQARADAIAKVIGAEPHEPWVVWCDTDYEADALLERLPSFVDVRGSVRSEVKEDLLRAFSIGEAPGIVTKPSIAGFGLNWQHCARMAFIGLSFSYESFYQAVRRCWRFGQTRPVEVHVAMAETEMAIWNVINRKTGDHDAMKQEMAAAMARAMRIHRIFEDYRPVRNVALPEWLKGQAHA